MHVHLCPADKFIAPFIDFVRNNDCGLQHHFFIQRSNLGEYGISSADDITFLDTPADHQLLASAMERADKLYLHSLWVYAACRLLLNNPAWLSRCYWNMWGGDFYNPSAQSEAIHVLVRYMGYCLTDIPGDFDLARQWYGATGEHLPCMGYPTNVFDHPFVPASDNATIRIQIGNSASPANNHLGMLPRLAPLINQDIEVYAPLCYGDSNYAAQVCEWGKQLLGDQFIPILEPMPAPEYAQFLASIDIALFNHERQQALGNIIPLLGMGKTVYLNSNTSHYQRLTGQSVNVRDIAAFNMNRLSADEATHNHKTISAYWNQQRLIDDWSGIFLH